MCNQPKLLLVISTFLSLTGCNTPNIMPPVSPPSDGIFRVQPHDIINIIKCEMHKFYSSFNYPGIDPDFMLDPKKLTDVELKLKLEAKGDAKGSVKTIQLGQLLGASLGANLEASISDTTETELHYQFKQQIINDGDMDPRACQKYKDATIGLNDALIDFFRSQGKIRTGRPYVRFKDITFSTSFLVEIGGGVNGSLPTIYLVPLSPSIELNANTNETHFLKIKFIGKNGRV